MKKTKDIELFVFKLITAGLLVTLICLICYYETKSYNENGWKNKLKIAEGEDKKEYMNPTSEATYEAAMEQMKKAQVYTKDGYLNVEKSSDNMIELINKQLDEMEKEKKNEGK